ncbi:MAG: Na+/H+ antiporter NhaA, partial [Cycloclasticus sp.]|nr:Na+/H+ antiporter NhaA [Cycloclasticus sp.]
TGKITPKQVVLISGTTSDSQFKMSLLHWINDGLMALFFFLLGLEIKREMLAGELQDFSQTVPVVSAAIGGMIFPAVLFYLLNVDTDTAKGWGIPMATDTAFAVGILALLSSRVPSSAFAFLTALAIIDDIGAMLVIAIFYTDSISPEYLFLGVLTFITLLSFNKLGIRKGWVYLVGGLILWVMLYKSGVHATVAGIIVAFSVPARPKHESDWFIRKTQKLMNKFEKIEKDKSSDGTILGDVTQHRIVENVQEVAKKASTPLRRWEHALERPVALLVLPIFALANAGIPVSPNTLTTIWNDSLAGGIVIGLVIGKSLGIPLLAWVAIYFKLGRLPDNLTLKHVIGIGMLAGMGFTMSIFIADLGFDEPDHLVAAKSGILVASLIAGVSGWLWLRFFCNEEINDTPERDL